MFHTYLVCVAHAVKMYFFIMTFFFVKRKEKKTGYVNLDGIQASKYNKLYSVIQLCNSGTEAGLLTKNKSKCYESL